MTEALFEVSGLHVVVHQPVSVGDDGREHALDDPWVEVISDASFRVAPGEVLALIGESGSGKSLMLLGSIGLLPAGARVTAVDTKFNGEQVGKVSGVIGDPLEAAQDEKWRSLVGVGIGVLFQNPIAGWDPLETIGEQSGDVLEEHFDLSGDEIEERVLAALGEVKLPKRRKFFSFRHELSRGEAQRAMLAAALLSKPALLLADEPLTGLDTTVAAAVLDLIRDLITKRGMAMVVVSHDLAQIAAVAHRVAVVYGGRVVEQGPIEEIYYRPKHPYTEGLLGSIPGFGPRLRPIPGDPPELTNLPAGCAYQPRCPYAVPQCAAAVPDLTRVEATDVRCIRASELMLNGVG